MTTVIDSPVGWVELQNKTGYIPSDEVVPYGKAFHDLCDFFEEKELESCVISQLFPCVKCNKNDAHELLWDYFDVNRADEAIMKYWDENKNELADQYNAWWWENKGIQYDWED